MKKEYTIDVDKWVCGEWKLGKHSRGSSMLLNRQGYMCCLGQICQQSGIKKSRLEHQYGPEGLDKTRRRKVPFLINNNSISLCSDLASEAMDINDRNKCSYSKSMHYMLKERISDLKTLFTKHGIKLRFKNIKKYLK